MKITSTEEYGLRIMLTIARNENEQGMTIEDISKEEGISSTYAAKLLRLLRIEGFVESSRGKSGGYTLSRDASEIGVADLLSVLGGKLYDKQFCANHSGIGKLCTNSTDCSVRSLWQIIQFSIDNILNELSLADLIGGSDKVEELTEKKSSVRT